MWGDNRGLGLFHCLYVCLAAFRLNKISEM